MDRNRFRVVCVIQLSRCRATTARIPERSLGLQLRYLLRERNLVPMRSTISKLIFCWCLVTVLLLSPHPALSYSPQSASVSGRQDDEDEDDANTHSKWSEFQTRNLVQLAARLRYGNDQCLPVRLSLPFSPVDEMAIIVSFQNLQTRRILRLAELADATAPEVRQRAGQSITKQIQSVAPVVVHEILAGNGLRSVLPDQISSAPDLSSPEDWAIASTLAQLRPPPATTTLNRLLAASLAIQSPATVAIASESYLKSYTHILKEVNRRRQKMGLRPVEALPASTTRHQFAPEIVLSVLVSAVPQTNSQSVLDLLNSSGAKVQSVEFARWDQNLNTRPDSAQPVSHFSLQIVTFPLDAAAGHKWKLAFHLQRELKRWVKHQQVSEPDARPQKSSQNDNQSTPVASITVSSREDLRAILLSPELPMLAATIRAPAFGQLLAGPIGTGCRNVPADARFTREFLAPVTNSSGLGNHRDLISAGQDRFQPNLLTSGQPTGLRREGADVLEISKQQTFSWQSKQETRLIQTWASPTTLESAIDRLLARDPSGKKMRSESTVLQLEFPVNLKAVTLWGDAFQKWTDTWLQRRDQEADASFQARRRLFQSLRDEILLWVLGTETVQFDASRNPSREEFDCRLTLKPRTGGELASKLKAASLLNLDVPEERPESNVGFLGTLRLLGHESPMIVHLGGSYDDRQNNVDFFAFTTDERPKPEGLNHKLDLSVDDIAIQFQSFLNLGDIAWVSPGSKVASAHQKTVLKRSLAGRLAGSTTTRSAIGSFAINLDQLCLMTERPFHSPKRELPDCAIDCEGSVSEAGDAIFSFSIPYQKAEYLFAVAGVLLQTALDLALE